MDLTLTPAEEAFRDEFRAWLQENIPEPFAGNGEDDGGRAQFDYMRQWQQALYEGGWAGINWPADYGGRGATLMEQALYQEEMALADAPGVPGVLGLALIGPTIIALGTEEQKTRYLPKILSGEEIWCQGFSEPNAGSDLASLSTRAATDADDFIVNGQKIWTSYAHWSDMCMLLVRTDPEAAKHKGITALLVDMDADGVTTKPLRMMSGDAMFNEVFFSDVRVPKDRVLGTVNEGWTGAITALMNERSNLGGSAVVRFRKDLEVLIDRAKVLPREDGVASDDPVIRQKLAQAYIDLEVFKMTGSRALSRIIKSGAPGPEGSILKLFWSEMNQRNAQIAMETLGAHGQRHDLDGGRWAYNYLRSRGNTIEAGTSQVLRNIVAQRVLGLPRSY